MEGKEGRGRKEDQYTLKEEDDEEDESKETLQVRTKSYTRYKTVTIMLHDTIIVYASETQTWNEGQKSRIQADEMSYQRGACGLNRMDGESNKSVCGKFAMSVKSEGMNCVVVEVVKRSILRWFDDFEGMEGNELTERIYNEWKRCCGCEGKAPCKM